LLWESQTEELIRSIQSLSVKTKQKQAAKDKLLYYYQSNKDRRDYKKYRTMGAGLIGSGAIESAHRTVIQKRMKQSGQLWSQNSPQHMLALRYARRSGRWNKIVNLIGASTKAA
jgi:ribosomal protein L16/L10AE